MSDRLGLTPSQTVGPFLSIGLHWEDGPYVAPEQTPTAIRIGGVVLDGAGEGVPDAIVETWQADPDGRFDHPDDPRGARPGFRGFGRCSTDAEGNWSVVTVKPGPLPSPNGTVEAPHLTVSVFARGLLDRLVTRIYFPDEGDANALDPLLSGVAEDRRSTLVACEAGDGLRFDIRLQGHDETVFFSL